MVKINGFKSTAITLAMILIVQLFAAPVFATQNNPETTGTGGVVEVVDMDWDEVNRLLDESQDVTFDGFGDKDAYEEYRAAEQAEIGLTPGVENVSHQFTISNAGEPVLLYDLIQQRAVKPDDVGYLSHLTTQGFMSYTTAIDQTTRICPQYPDEHCEAGHLNPAEAQELSERLAAQEDEIQQGISQVQEGLTTITDYFGGDEGVENTTAELQAIQDKLDQESVVNTIQSNHSMNELTHADSILLFPHHLAKFTQYLSNLQGGLTGDKMYGIAKLGSAALGVTSAVQSYRAGKLAKRGATGLKGSDSTQGIKTAKKQAQAVVDDPAASLAQRKKAQEVLDTTRRADVTTDGEFYEALQKAGPGDDGLVGVRKADALTEKHPHMIEDIKPHVYTGEIIDPDGKAFSVTEANSKAVNELLAGDSTAWSKATGVATKEEYVQSLDYINAYTGESLDSAADVTRLVDKSAANEVFEGLMQKGSYANMHGIESFMGGAGAASTSAKALGVIAPAVRNVQNAVFLQRGMLAVSFFSMEFFGQPKPTMELISLSVEAQPDRIIQDKEAYLEIARATETAHGQDFYPAGVFTNLMEFFKFEPEAIMEEDDADTIKNKIMTDPGPKYVMGMDQESGAEAYAEPPINMIYPTTTAGQDRWMIHNRNPGTADYYSFEHPDSYAENEDALFTTLTLVVKNLDLSGLTPVEAEWAEHSTGWMMDYTPTTKEMLAGAGIAGAFGGVSGFTGLAGEYMPHTGGGWTFAKTFLYVALGKGVGQLGTETSDRIAESGYGELVDVGKAYSEGEPCSQVLEEYKDDIDSTRRWMWLTLGLEGGMDIASIGAAQAKAAGQAGMITGPKGALIISGVNIAAIMANYWQTREYADLKRDGLEDMRQCQETEFEILAFDRMPKEKEEDGMLDQIKGQLGDSLSKIPGLDSISPEASQRISSLGEEAYLNTMTLSGRIEEESLTNLEGSELYQIHFDREADVKWFLKEQQNIEFCEQVGTTPRGEPQFECMRKQGYHLFDSEGNPILEGPQTRGIRWDNDRTLMTIPQRVINVKQSADKDPLMSIKHDTVDIDHSEVQDTVADLIKKTDTSQAFGELQTINTENAVIWHEGDTTVVRLTAPIKETYGKGQIVRFDNTEIQLYRNNEIELIKEGTGEQAFDYTFQLEEDDFLSFTNGKIVPGRGGERQVTIDGENVTRNFDNWNHIIIYDLLSFSTELADSYSLSDELLELCKDELGIQGLTLQGDFDFGEDERTNELLRDICLSYIEGQNNQSIRIEDNQVCYKDMDGEVVCREIVGFEDGKIQLEDGYSLGVNRGPDGEPEFQFYRNGEKVDSPIPLLRATGQGGTLNFDAQAGEVSISNEFPFQLNPEFGRIGAGMENPGMVIPKESPWGQRPRPPHEIDAPAPEPSPIAQLPSTPTNPIALIIFITTILGGVLIIKNKNKLN